MTHPLFTFEALADDGLIHPEWAQALEPRAAEIDALGRLIGQEVAGGAHILPNPHEIFRAFAEPLASVKVLIVGQDPYPTPGHPIGLAFGVHEHVRPLPRSLANIYKELHADLGIPPATHGDLSSWTTQGVMLLNRTLTVQAGHAGSHAGLGWESVTSHAIRTLADRGGALVTILWGNQARSLAAHLGDLPVIESAHPSPLSSSRGFFGSRPFSRTNHALEAAGASAIDWRIPEHDLIASVTTS